MKKRESLKNAYTLKHLLQFDMFMEYIYQMQYNQSLLLSLIADGVQQGYSSS